MDEAEDRPTMNASAASAAAAQGTSTAYQCCVRCSSVCWAEAEEEARLFSTLEASSGGATANTNGDTNAGNGTSSAADDEEEVDEDDEEPAVLLAAPTEACKRMDTVRVCHMTFGDDWYVGV